MPKVRPAPLTLATGSILVPLMAAGAFGFQEPDTTAQRPPEPVLPAQTEATAPADTEAVAVFPRFPAPASRVAGGVAVDWRHRDLLATGALTLADLVEHLPTLTPVRAGFLEGPQVAVLAGRGPASLRYSIDGYEIAPFLGGPLDLHTLTSLELERLRLVREPGGYRLVGDTYRNERPEAYSRIEAGTGDRDTNVLRAFFASRLRGARLGFGYDRYDTDGNPLTGGAERNAIWAKLAHRLVWDVWGQLEWRSSSLERGAFPSTKRRDWILRLRRPFADEWFVDLVAGTSRLELQPASGDPVGVAVTDSVKRTASQVAVRAARRADRWQGYVSLRLWEGDGVPSFEPEAAIELELGPATAFVSGRFADWGDFQSAAGYGSLTLRLPLGLRLLAEVEEGDRGIFAAFPRRRLNLTRWTAGAELSLWGWRAGGRGGRWRADPSPALGAPFDSLAAIPGGTVSVVEAWAAGPLFRLFGGGVEVGGRYQRRDAGAFFYWPQDDWWVEGAYRLLALNGQLELWLTGLGGVRGAMFVLDESGIVGTGLDLNWFRGEAVVRVKDVHIYYNYETFNAAGPAADVSGMILPTARIHFGVKWEFWN